VRVTTSDYKVKWKEVIELVLKMNFEHIWCIGS